MVKKLVPLCENHLFSKAYRKGKTDANRYVAVYALKNFLRDKNGRPLPTKVGITVNKKLGKAVRRSRAKRLIRASFRECLPALHNGWFIIIAARSALFEKGVKSTDLTPKLARSLERLGVTATAEGEKTAATSHTPPNGQNRQGNRYQKHETPKNGGKHA